MYIHIIYFIKNYIFKFNLIYAFSNPKVDLVLEKVLLSAICFQSAGNIISIASSAILSIVFAAFKANSFTI